jgi:AcrR family transcriptional regulator
MATSGRANRGPSAAPENRKALLDAARDVFSDSGLDVPFNAIAKAAGVGQGVLYRHFPDRIDLVLAVFEENTSALETLSADRDTSLMDVLDFVTDQVIDSVAFVDMVTASTSDQRLDRVAHRLADALAEKLGPAKEAGQVRTDLTTDELVIAIGMIANLVAKLPTRDRRSTAEAAWALMWKGMSPR